MADAYTPIDGLKNAVSFPTEPADEAAARKQIQDMFDQILAFHNDHLADDVTDADGVHGLKIESGSFTPVLEGSEVAGTNAYTIQTGFYYKIGKLVHCDIQIMLSVKDATMAGFLRIKGLPFTSNPVGNRYYCAAVGSVFGFTHGTYNGVSATLSGNSNALTLRKLADMSEVIVSEDINNTFRLYFSVDYEIS